jgi:hypothetical protein
MIVTKALIFIAAATQNNILKPNLENRKPQINRDVPFPTAPEMSIQYKKIFF